MVRARRERVMRVEWPIGSEVDLGRGCDEVDSREREEGGSEEMMARCWGVVVRSTMLNYGSSNLYMRDLYKTIRIEEWL